MLTRIPSRLPGSGGRRTGRVPQHPDVDAGAAVTRGHLARSGAAAAVRLIHAPATTRPPGPASLLAGRFGGAAIVALMVTAITAAIELKVRMV
jgi:hypothetical protein